MNKIPEEINRSIAQNVLVLPPPVVVATLQPRKTTFKKISITESPILRRVRVKTEKILALNGFNTVLRGKEH